jgi:hypothetical protein
MLLPGGSRDAREIVSPYVQTVIDRNERDRERTSWKDDSFGWNVTRAGPMARMAALGPMAHGSRVRFTAAASAGPGELMYTLETDATGGLFRQTVSSGDELRIFHKQQMRVGDVASHPKTGMIAMALRKSDGTSHLCLMNPGGGGTREMTEGDVVDESPSWSLEDSGPRGTLVYHSAGLGRNAAGMLAGKGPYAVLKLDLDADELATLAESDNHDFLSPRMLADGTLLYIQRPYRPFGQPVSLKARLKDIIHFPLGVATAIVHFLDAFSRIFSKKPLITAGGAPREGPDPRHLMLWGMMINAEKGLKDSGGAAIVPKDWMLKRRAPDGAESVVANGVVAFDVCTDGSIVWTNGSSVKLRAGNGQDQVLCQGKTVERLMVVS